MGILGVHLEVGAEVTGKLRIKSDRRGESKSDWLDQYVTGDTR